MVTAAEAVVTAAEAVVTAAVVTAAEAVVTAVAEEAQISGKLRNFWEHCHNALW